MQSNSKGILSATSRRSLLSLVSVALLLSACATTRTAPSTAALDSERARYSYMVGLDQADQLAAIRDEIDIDVVAQAMRDAQAGTPKLDAEQRTVLRSAFAEHLRVVREAAHAETAAANQRAAEAFLADHARTAGVVTTASGLQYAVLRPGTGRHPTARDTVRVDYAGMLLDGTTFESTYATDHPAEFVVERVMPGLAEGLVQMQVGGKYRLWVPPALGYGERGAPGTIGPNAVLVFEIELLEIAGE